MSKQKILVLGGTGAMGKYVVPLLAQKGYLVDVYSMDEVKSDDPNIRYFVKDCYDLDNLRDILANGYDCIIDYLIYGSETRRFVDRYKLFLENTKHYIYLSTYRIYADLEHPVKETSPRLLDVSEDYTLLATNDYCLHKAKGESLLINSEYNNFTIIRPSITFSLFRYQLCTLEAQHTVGRALNGKKVLLPKGAADKRATLTWAGDTAKFFAAVVLNPNAFGETYSFTTHENYTWREMAEIYKDICGLQYEFIDDEDYIGIIVGDGNRTGARFQLRYDREFDRNMDNSKILSLAGMKPEDMTPLRKALSYEISRIPDGYYKADDAINQRMDKYITEKGL